MGGPAQLITSLLAALKEMPPLPLAIVCLAALSYMTLTVIQGNTVALTKVVMMADLQNINAQTIMRRLDLIEQYVSRR